MQILRNEISKLQNGVGQLESLLEKVGLLEKTLIIRSS